MQIETNINTATADVHSVATSIPTMDRPAGFQIYKDKNPTFHSATPHPKAPPLTMNKAMTSESLKQHADELVARRAIWEEGAYRSSTTELLALLADCLALYLHLKKFPDARKKFSVIYSEQALVGTKATSLPTKVIRYVFGHKAEKRTFAYAKVIEIAADQKIGPEVFSSFVINNGGIEEIRRNGASAEQKRQERQFSIERAENALKIRTPLAEKLAAPLGLKREGRTNFVAAIARIDDDGSLSLMHVTENETLVDALLAQAAKEGVSETAQASTYADERFNALSQ